MRVFPELKWLREFRNFRTADRDARVVFGFFRGRRAQNGYRAIKSAGSGNGPVYPRSGRCAAEKHRLRTRLVTINAPMEVEATSISMTTI